MGKLSSCAGRWQEPKKPAETRSCTLQELELATQSKYRILRLDQKRKEPIRCAPQPENTKRPQYGSRGQEIRGSGEPSDWRTMSGIRRDRYARFCFSHTNPADVAKTKHGTISNTVVILSSQDQSQPSPASLALSSKTATARKMKETRKKATMEHLIVHLADKGWLSHMVSSMAASGGAELRDLDPPGNAAGCAGSGNRRSNAEPAKVGWYIAPGDLKCFAGTGAQLLNIGEVSSDVSYENIEHLSIIIDSSATEHAIPTNACNDISTL